MAGINSVALLNGKVTQSSAADNATATATAAAIERVRHGGLGVYADYSAAVSAIKTITVKRGTTTLAVFRHDFAGGAFAYSFPCPVWSDYGEALSVELEASGTVGTSGRVALFHFTS